MPVTDERLELQLAQRVTKAIHSATSPLIDRIATLHDRVIGLEARWSDLNALRERVAVIETTEVPTITPERGEIGPPGVNGLDGKDAPPVNVDEIVARVMALIPLPKDGAKGDPGEPGRDGAPGLPGRDGLTGPQGETGLDGRTGLNGLSGRDGTLEHIKLMFDGERTVTFCFKNGDPIDGGTITFPVQIYRGVYQAGKVYEVGDTVTDGGQLWYCHAPGTVTSPGDASKLWQLCVRKGRDGKDGRDGDAPMSKFPVVKTQ